MRAQAAATAIQAHVRGYQTRDRVRKKYKKLLRLREKRAYRRRWKAAVKIQSVARMYNARLVVNRRRELVSIHKKKRTDKAQLESRVTAFHDKYLNDLLLTRVQNGIREKLARGYVHCFCINIYVLTAHISKYKHINFLMLCLYIIHSLLFSVFLFS